MKISVILPSRNRPAGLLAVLTSFNALASGQNEIAYGVIVDDDDYVTLEQYEHWERSGMLPSATRWFCAPRGKTINARFNEAVAAMPADVYSQACDDHYPLAFHWDRLIAGAMQQIPALNWQELNDPTNATVPVLAHKWVEAVGRFYPEYFPFWFADTWLAEVHALAFAKPMPVVNQLPVGGKRAETQGMRELRFWFEFFAATRIERCAEAVRLAKAFGFSVNPETDRADILARLREGDAYQLSRVEQYERAFHANRGEPSAAYKAARYRAEVWLAEHEKAAA